MPDELRWFAKEALRHRIRRQKHKALGLCCDCSNPVWGVLVRCKICIAKRTVSTIKGLETSRLYHQRLRRQWKASGKCERCGAPLMEGEGIECFNCSRPNRKSMCKQGVLKYETAN